jgi:hypothetical protein
LVAQVPNGSPVQLDNRAVNSAALELVAVHGMAQVFETARMYAGAAPALAIDWLFGVAMFEQG